MRPPPETAVRAFRTGDDTTGWFDWGIDQANALRLVLDAVLPFTLGSALSAGQVILEPGNSWEWQGFPTGWVQVGPNVTPWPPVPYG